MLSLWPPTPASADSLQVANAFRHGLLGVRDSPGSDSFNSSTISRLDGSSAIHDPASIRPPFSRRICCPHLARRPPHLGRWASATADESPRRGWWGRACVIWLCFGANFLPRSLWRALARLASDCDLTIWMVVHQPRLELGRKWDLVGTRRYLVGEATAEIAASASVTVPGDEPPSTFDRQTAAQIRRLAPPRQAAALTLVLATELGPDDLRTLGLRSVTEDGRVLGAETPWAIPVPGG